MRADGVPHSLTVWKQLAPDAEGHLGGENRGAQAQTHSPLPDTASTVAQKNVSTTHNRQYPRSSETLQHNNQSLLWGGLRQATANTDAQIIGVLNTAETLHTAQGLQLWACSPKGVSALTRAVGTMLGLVGMQAPPQQMRHAWAAGTKRRVLKQDSQQCAGGGLRRGVTLRCRQVAHPHPACCRCLRSNQSGHPAAVAVVQGARPAPQTLGHQHPMTPGPAAGLVHGGR